MTAPAAGAPARRALLIGINAYRAPERALTGCVNDVELIETVARWQRLLSLHNNSDTDGDFIEENWILIAMMQPADFASYAQTGKRGSAVENVSTRSIIMGPPKLDDDWAVVRPTLTVRRARA